MLSGHGGAGKAVKSPQMPRAIDGDVLCGKNAPAGLVVSTSKVPTYLETKEVLYYSNKSIFYILLIFLLVLLTKLITPL